ncbi:unnamed protein product [Rangifer tarandus platyrhynchus]|uniref:Uncharacterized protein n=2 Tax=Rangifer tarandus platyrhynchus TaxID=3082113 RepID=A0ABN8ZS65_RANTA|nr:unnamed protein product [Rangifer tarandus platyrhynchus]
MISDILMQIKGQKLVSSLISFWLNETISPSPVSSTGKGPLLLNHILPVFCVSPKSVSAGVCGGHRVQIVVFWEEVLRTFLDTELLVVPTCLYPETALYLQLCLWS